ncbi:MAG: radical SAM protein [Bacteroidetes bacterium]|nr:radical SAM protein [Bacteroidota bacterium]
MAHRAIEKILFFNPPGPMYQRGEDRCQANIEESSAVSLRAPNDLAYMAAMVRQLGVAPVIRDYPAERLNWKAFQKDLEYQQPDMVVMSTTNATLLEDLLGFSIVRTLDETIITVAKGAIFHACDLSLLDEDSFNVLDFALAGESESLIRVLIQGLREQSDFANLEGLVYRQPDGRWARNKQTVFHSTMDDMPFPARDLLRNELYVRPDTGEPQATIQTSRGCPSSCIFCLTPLISGNQVRHRSASNIVDEIEECVNKYGIRNFFFKADTFTINKTYVIDLCREILRRGLEIQWVANSRVDTVCDERLEWMRKAGCWLIAFGFESGNDAILKKMKKEATSADAQKAVDLAKKWGLQVYGFFMIGLPWDTMESMEETLRLAENLDCDFYEFHMATPFEGTELYRLATSLRLIQGTVVGHDYFSDPGLSTLYLSQQQVMNFRRKALRRLYLNPGYVMRTVSKMKSPTRLKNFVLYGWRFLRKSVLSRS